MPSLTSTISSFPTSTILSPRPDTQPPLPIPTPPPPPTTPSRLEHQSTHIAAGPMGTAIVLLFVDAILRYRPPIPLPSRDTSLNYQHSSRWASGTSYCRPVADTSPPTPDPIRPQPRPSRHDTGLKYQPRISRALGTACVRLSTTPPAPDRSEANPELNNPISAAASAPN